MGLDGRTIRIIAFCFVFLGTFVTLLGLMPTEFAYSGKQYAGFEEKVPPTWNGIDLLHYNFTGAWNGTLDASGSATFSVGGRNLGLIWTFVSGSGNVRLYHRYGLGLIWHEDMDWYNRAGIKKSYEFWGQYLHSDALDEDFSTYNDIQFNVACLGQGAGSSTFKIKVLFSFNSVYTSPENAWFHNDLDILIGITIDYVSSAIDAYFIITNLLTFNTVEVFGNSAPESIGMNFVLVLPFLACIIIPAALFLLEVIDRLTPF